MDSILEKSENYKRQMAPILAIVLPFAKARNWDPLWRGRKAHASIYGPVSGMSGVIDIEVGIDKWEDMPNYLEPDTPFTLWSSATKDCNGIRLFADTELYWKTPFSELEIHVPLFLFQAWTMLLELKEHGFVKIWNGPSMDPDLPPDFGPPRKRVNH